MYNTIYRNILFGFITKTDYNYTKQYGKNLYIYIYIIILYLFVWLPQWKWIINVKEL